VPEVAVAVAVEAVVVALVVVVVVVAAVVVVVVAVLFACQGLSPVWFSKKPTKRTVLGHLAARRPFGTFTRLVFLKNQQNSRCLVHLAARRLLEWLFGWRFELSPWW